VEEDMQTNVNVIVVEGGVVNDPELKYTQDGLAFTRFSLANSCAIYRNGEREKDTNYFDVKVWGKLAEICATYLRKGKRVIISGKLKQNKWKTAEGKSRSAVSIVAQDVKFLPSQRKAKD
jgi:single-strand DNA-binding protein